MSKSIKFKNNNYLDSTSIVHKKKPLSQILSEPVYIEHSSTDSFTGIRKQRIIDNVKYIATLGVGGDKTSAIEIINEDTGEVLGRLGVCIDGTIINWKTNKQLVEAPSIITNTNGTAIKYNDGTLICYGEVASNSNLTAWGNLFGYDDNTVRNFPQAFTSKPKIVVTNVGSSASLISRTVVTATAITQIAYCRPTQMNSTYYFNYVAIGRWK